MAIKLYLVKHQDNLNNLSNVYKFKNLEKGKKRRSKEKTMVQQINLLRYNRFVNRRRFLIILVLLGLCCILHELLANT